MEIDNLLSNINTFKGTFAKDEFKGKIHNFECGVINIDDSTGPGTHFTAYVNMPDHDKIYYFDSYGAVPPRNIVKYLKSSGKEIAYNNSHLQQLQSVVCGWYVIKFIMEMNKGTSFYDFLQQFNDDQKSNDDIVMNWALSNYPNFFSV